MSRCAAVAPYAGGAFLPASTAPGSLFSVSPLPFVRWCPSRQALQGGIHKAALYKTSPLQGLPPGALSSHGNGLTENGEQGRVANRQKRKNERRGIFGAGEPRGKDNGDSKKLFEISASDGAAKAAAAEKCKAIADTAARGPARTAAPEKIPGARFSHAFKPRRKSCRTTRGQNHCPTEYQDFRGYAFCREAGACWSDKKGRAPVVERCKAPRSSACKKNKG